MFVYGRCIGYIQTKYFYISLQGIVWTNREDIEDMQVFDMVDIEDIQGKYFIYLSRG